MEDVIYRKYDSDDVMRIRGESVISKVENGKEFLRVDTGKLQKVSTCLGIKKCPWFSDEINDKDGVSDVVFHKRLNKEFRLIPVDKIDVLFKEIQEFNKTDFEEEVLKKK